jgi:hypothetical protein
MFLKACSNIRWDGELVSTDQGYTGEEGGTGSLYMNFPGGM